MGRSRAEFPACFSGPEHWSLAERDRWLLPGAKLGEGVHFS